MKKFYYKKENSIDKTPIFLRLERRRTIKDTGDEDQGRLAARSTSISGLDQLKYDPSIPRARTREITKSLSEDVLSSCSYTTPSGVVITEAELSSSWLYKNMKAAANSKNEKDSETTTSAALSQQEQDLTPKVLQDPKMKPIPVPVAGRSKKRTSCCCYLAIMIAISLCTIGFLSTIGGILYMELISNENMTVYPTDETTDTTEPLHQAHLQDIKDSTEVSDQTEDANFDQEFKSPKTDSVDSINATEDQQKTIRILDFGKPLGAESGQYIDNKKTAIRLQNGNSIIYEENMSNSLKHLKHEQNSNASESNSDEESFQDNKTESNLSEVRDSNEISEVETRVIDVDVIKVTETVRDLNTDPVRNTNLSEKVEKNLYSNVTQNSDAVKDIERTENDTELNSNDSLDFAEDEQSVKQTFAEKVGKVQAKDVSSVTYKIIDTKITDKKTDNKSIIYADQFVSEQSSESLGKSDTDLKSITESVKNGIHEAISDKTDEEESILVFDDSGYESHQDGSENDAFISNRKGYITVFEVPDSRTETAARTKTVDRHSGMSGYDLSQRLRQQMRTGEIQAQKKPVNRVTVAEVMKQLKTLDVNNRLASSRMKSGKPSIKKIKLAPKNIPKNKLTETLEKKQYLEKLRAMLYEQLQ